MAKWTAALFGHYKHNYELREKMASNIKMPMGANYKGNQLYRYEVINWTVSRHIEIPTDFDTDKYFVYEVIGNERRAMPGDVIAMKPYGEDWTETEKKEFLIITIDGLETRDQVQAAIESYYDTATYPLYQPMDYDTWYALMLSKAEGRKNSAKAINLLKVNKAQWFEDYIRETKEFCRYPRGANIAKRRFHIPIDDLLSFGIDSEQMLCPNCLYVPEIRVIDIHECRDKLKDQYVTRDHNFNTIKPLIDEELRTE